MVSIVNPYNVTYLDLCISAASVYVSREPGSAETVRVSQRGGAPPTLTSRSPSGRLSHLRLRRLQPICHPHLAVHRRRGGEMLLRLLALARAPGELAEAEVTVGDQRAHAELVGERQRLAVIGLSGSPAAR